MLAKWDHFFSLLKVRMIQWRGDAIHLQINIFFSLLSSAYKKDRSFFSLRQQKTLSFHGMHPDQQLECLMNSFAASLAAWRWMSWEEGKERERDRHDKFDKKVRFSSQAWRKKKKKKQGSKSKKSISFPSPLAKEAKKTQFQPQSDRSQAGSCGTHTFHMQMLVALDLSLLSKKPNV